MATVLHSFYSGIEKMFTIIAKEIDRNLPDGKNWHNNLLIQMSQDSKLRKAVISESALNILDDYLAFRHFFRHAYSFHLEWNKVEDVSTNLLEVWQKVKKELVRFIEGI